MSDEVRIGVIGCGGNARGHMRTLTEMEGARVVAVIGLDGLPLNFLDQLLVVVLAGLVAGQFLFEGLDSAGALLAFFDDGVASFGKIVGQVIGAIVLVENLGNVTDRHVAAGWGHLGEAIRARQQSYGYKGAGYEHGDGPKVSVSRHGLIFLCGYPPQGLPVECVPGPGLAVRHCP